MAKLLCDQILTIVSFFTFWLKMTVTVPYRCEFVTMFRFSHQQSSPSYSSHPIPSLINRCLVMNCDRRQHSEFLQYFLIITFQGRKNSESHREFATICPLQRLPTRRVGRHSFSSMGHWKPGRFFKQQGRRRRGRRRKRARRWRVRGLGRTRWRARRRM